MKKIPTILFGLSLLGIFILPGSVLAARVDILDDACRGKANQSAACKDNDSGSSSSPIYGQGGILTRIVNILTILVGIAAVITIVVAGLKFITSGSEPQEVTKSREMILYAIVALLIAALAQFIVRFFLNNLPGN